jgi:hypothetical protein
LGGASAKTLRPKAWLEMALTADDLPSVFSALLTLPPARLKFGEKIVRY